MHNSWVLASKSNNENVSSNNPKPFPLNPHCHYRRLFLEKDDGSCRPGRRGWKTLPLTPLHLFSTKAKRSVTVNQTGGHAVSISHAHTPAQPEIDCFLTSLRKRMPAASQREIISFPAFITPMEIIYFTDTSVDTASIICSFCLNQTVTWIYLLIWPITVHMD